MDRMRRGVSLVLERGAQKAGLSQESWNSVFSYVKCIWEKKRLQDLRYCYKYLHEEFTWEL